MTLIDDVIETAHTHGLVHATWREADGRDGYTLRAWPRPVTVWVLEDGRFARALSDGKQLTLGQVMSALDRQASDVPG